MALYRFKVLTKEEADQRGIINSPGPGPFVIGDGPDDYVCGNCNQTITKSVSLSDLIRIENAAFKCFTCKAINSL
jgi:hypothetical protein